MIDILQLRVIAAKRILHAAEESALRFGKLHFESVIGEEFRFS